MLGLRLGNRSPAMPRPWEWKGAVRLGSYTIQRILWAQANCKCAFNSRKLLRASSAKGLKNALDGMAGTAAPAAAWLQTLSLSPHAAYFGLEAGVFFRSPTIALQF